MRLFTSHWRSSLLKDVDATIIGVSRGTPRRSTEYKYRLLKSLAPDDRAWSMKGRAAFERAYLYQLEELGAERILTDLKAIAGDRPAILLCWERLTGPDEWCHRTLLARFLEEKAGFQVPELELGMIPPRPDTPEPNLFWE